MPTKTATPELTSLSDLVTAHGRDVRYWAGFVAGMNLPTLRGKNNAICLRRESRERLDALVEKQALRHA